MDIDNQNTRHANRVRLLMDGVAIAEGTQCQIQEGGGAEPIHVVDSEYPIEHVHNRYSAQGSIQSLAWKRGGLKQLNPGGGELVQIKEFDIVPLDRSDAAIMWAARRCTFTNRSMTVSANQPVSRNVSFAAITVDDGGGSRGMG